MEALSLHSNALGELPRELCALRGVVRLSLYQNQLRGLPEEIGDMIGLQVGLAGSSRSPKVFACVCSSSL